MIQELDEMKKRLKEIEEEAAALREMQSKAEKDMGSVQDPNVATSQASKEEVDSRSIFVGNMNLFLTAKNLQHNEIYQKLGYSYILKSWNNHPVFDRERVIELLNLALH
ncbi:hypothetical protein Leryth_005419 [Lithospermum erythrorhizon]|nr:hypothetical protein Leryth_005419 [Lithospermum erythrorhizon]